MLIFFNMKKYNIIGLFTLFILFNSNITNAEQVSLKQVATEILRNSNIKKSNEYSLKAANEESDRTAKHWLPNLYIDNSTYQTNDASKILMGNLSQRSITQNDFVPDTMNTTMSKCYSRSSLGINIPLFQGGAGVASANAAKHLELSKRYDFKQIELTEYSNIAITYISIVSLEKQKEKLLTLKAKVDNFVKQYAIGEKGNPVGYSGLLVLQTLQNKINALMEDNNSKRNLLYTILVELGFTYKKPWQVEHFSVLDHINKYLNYDLSNKDSFTIISEQEKIDAAKNQVIINKAKNLPNVNLFAENYVFTGSRATKPGYTVGLNFRWNLFNTATYNIESTAKNSYESSRYALLDQKQKENTEIDTLKSQIQSSKNNLTLAIRSEKLMFENIEVSEDMFKNGSINTQVLADSIMKYLDTFVFLYNIELQLIDTYAKKLTKQQINVFEILSTI